MKPALVSLGLAAIIVCVAPHLAQADLPPEPGWTKVNYKYRLDTAVDGRTIIAYPTYNTKDNDSHMVVLDAGADQGVWQGYKPGIYSVKTSDAASLPKDEDALQKFLDSHAELCLKHIPRVFQVPTKTGVQQITDVIHIEMASGKCQATLAKTVYQGPDGKSGEGGVDATGKRLPPAPFGSEIPPLEDAGFVLTASSTPTPSSSSSPSSSAAPVTTPDPPKTTDPKSGGCAGCSVERGSGTTLGVGAAVLLGLAALLRVRARRSLR